VGADAIGLLQLFEIRVVVVMRVGVQPNFAAWWMRKLYLFDAESQERVS
jgi:hypothetical protein